MNAGINTQSNPFQYSAPNTNMGGMFGQAQGMVRGGGYPGGPSFGMAPQLAGQQQAMQNAMYGMNTSKNAMGYNLGLAGQNQQWNQQFNPTPFDFAGAGVAGLGAIGAIGQRQQQQQMYQNMGAGLPGMGGY
jgi:hypothetical protein